MYAAHGLTTVLHGIDLSLEAGSITTLLGAKGTGKTTALRALCGMVGTAAKSRPTLNGSTLTSPG